MLVIGSIERDAPVPVILHTTAVHRGSVHTTVVATGKLAPVATLSLSFVAGGVVTEVDVKTGDRVKAGQTLAKIDDAQTMAAVLSAQAALTSAEHNVVDARQHATPVVARVDAVAVAQQQVAAAQSILNAAVQGAAINAIGYQSSVNQVRAQLSRDRERYSNDQAACPAGAATSCAAALVQDQNAIASDTESVVNADQQQTSGERNDEQSIQEATNSCLAAQEILASMLASGNADPAGASMRMAAAQSQVIQAQGDLAVAQKNEADTTLTAPSDGTVGAVNGVVGQVLSGDGTMLSSGAGASTGGTSPSALSASSAFLILSNDSPLQIVVGFAGADAEGIQVGQRATITVEELPNQPLSGQVTEIDDNSAAVNAITRNVAVNLDDPPATLKAGMTAHVSVVARIRDNVLEVPTADVTTTDGTSSVILVHNGRQIRVEVTTGLVGAASTEITSGLYDGETIVDPR
jgi:multidrug efflux pump subunit AcrA (membrane-fusion protein)